MSGRWRTWVKQTEYKTPVSRARRVSPRAITYLTGHSEDWHSQTFVGVKPARVLALHREDQWDIYENVATKNLIEYLNVYINKRLQALAELDGAFEELCQFYEEQGGGIVTENYMRTLRKYFKNDDQTLEHHKQLLSETKIPLEDLQKRLRGLMGTQFYREVSNKKIPLQLQFTNLLQNHQHYRYVAIFWNYWLQESGSSLTSEDQILNEQEELCKHLVTVKQ